MTLTMLAIAASLLTVQVPRDTAVAPAPGSSTLAGVVQTSDTPPQPVRRAVVTLSGAETRGDRQFITDETGRFAFDGLPAGRYLLTAEKPAFVKSYFGSRRPGRPPASPIVLAVGQRADIRLQLIRGAVIEGTIRDEYGAPLASAQVTIQQPLFVSGERKLVNAPVPLATTDERGRYRVYGLPAGEYTVSVGGGGGGVETTQADIDAALRDRSGPEPPRPSQVGRGRRYLPSTTDPSAAEMIVLAAGEERTGADISMPFVPVSRASGLSVGPTGQPMTNVWMVMTAGAERTCWVSSGGIRPDAAGRFSLPSVVAGNYSLIARGEEGRNSPSGPPTPMPLWAEIDFLVTGTDLSDLLLQFAPGMSVSGRAVFRGTHPPQDPTTIRVSLARTNPSGCGEPTPMPSVAPAADGTFTLSGLPPGRYRMTTTGAAAPWILRSASLDGRDTLDTTFEIPPGRPVSGIELVFTDQPAEITGVVTDTMNRPVHEYSVVAFPTDRALWPISPRRLSGAIKLASDGRYRIAGLPPGTYYVSVLTDIDPRQAVDPSVLESLIPMAITVSLAEGERKTQDLKIGRIADASIIRLSHDQTSHLPAHHARCRIGCCGLHAAVRPDTTGFENSGAAADVSAARHRPVA